MWKMFVLTPATEADPEIDHLPSASSARVDAFQSWGTTKNEPSIHRGRLNSLTPGSSPVPLSLTFLSLSGFRIFLWVNPEYAGHNGQSYFRLFRAPRARDQELVLAFTPVSHKMYIRNLVLRDRPSMFCYYHLKFCFCLIKEVRDRGKNPADPLDVGRNSGRTGLPWQFLHCWPGFREVNLAGLVNHQETRNGVLLQR